MRIAQEARAMMLEALDKGLLGQVDREVLDKYIIKATKEVVTNYLFPNGLQIQSGENMCKCKKIKLLNRITSRNHPHIRDNLRNEYCTL